ncbi:hypothetical protein [Cohnella sp. 56]|uniref:hypothetical protein n=1 Tax=Cohnella sp. 56 TaxID=3113722 RepID=UPI0030EAE7DC
MAENQKTAEELAAEKAAADKAAKAAKAAEKLTDKDFDKAALSTGEQLALQDKVRVRVYLDPDARDQLEAQEQAGGKVVWPYTTVQINGYTYQIQLGKEVEVPESVAEVLRQSKLI